MIIFKTRNKGNVGIHPSISQRDGKTRVFDIYEDPRNEFDFFIIEDKRRFPDLREFFSEKQAIRYLNRKFGYIEKITTRNR